MCGRTAVAMAAGTVGKTAKASGDWVGRELYKPSYNVQPGAWTPCIVGDKQGAGGRQIRSMKWGLVPSFTKLKGEGAKLDHFRLMNARSESVSQKHIFSRLLRGPCAPRALSARVALPVVDGPSSHPTPMCGDTRGKGSGSGR